MNETGKVDNFQVPGALSPVAWVLKLQVACSPTTGLEIFITTTHGYAIITLIRISNLMELNESLEIIVSFLSSERQRLHGCTGYLRYDGWLANMAPIWGYALSIVDVGPLDTTKDAQTKYGITLSRQSYR